jgi:hypothetical protein
MENCRRWWVRFKRGGVSIEAPPLSTPGRQGQAHAVLAPNHARVVSISTPPPRRAPLAPKPGRLTQSPCLNCVGLDLGEKQHQAPIIKRMTAIETDARFARVLRVSSDPVAAPCIDAAGSIHTIVGRLQQYRFCSAWVHAWRCKLLPIPTPRSFS